MLFDSQAVQTNRNLLKFDNSAKPAGDAGCFMRLSQFVLTNKH